jgi:hypothetical protein
MKSSTKRSSSTKLLRPPCTNRLLPCRQMPDACRGEGAVPLVPGWDHAREPRSSRKRSLVRVPAACPPGCAGSPGGLEAHASLPLAMPLSHPSHHVKP